MGASSLGEHDQPAHTPWHFRDIFQAVSGEGWMATAPEAAVPLQRPQLSLRDQEGCRHPTCALPAIPSVSLDLQTHHSSRARREIW